MLINFVGILYIVFVMDEPKPRVKEHTDKELATMLPETKKQDESTAIESVTHKTGNMCTNVVKDCTMVIIRKRDDNGRKIVYIGLIIVGLSAALEYGMITTPYEGVLKSKIHLIYVPTYVVVDRYTEIGFSLSLSLSRM